LWYAGFVPPTNLGQPIPPVPANTAALVAQKDEARAAAQRTAAEAQAAKAQLDAVTAALKKADLDPKTLPAAVEQARKSQAELAKLNALFRQANVDPAALPGLIPLVAQTRTVAEESRQARAKLAAIEAQVRQANLDPSDLPGAVRLLAAAHGKADPAADARLAQLRDEFALAQAESLASEARLKAQVDQLVAAQAGLTEFRQAVGKRLQAARLAAPNAAPAALLTGLDRALERRPYAAAAAEVPEQATRALSSGWSAYAAGDYARAERDFAAAAQAGERNAVAYYFLGLARAAEGQQAAADAAFRQGVALERQNQPNPGEVERALERLPTASRRLVNAYRR
jgi:hypothetical protein